MPMGYSIYAIHKPIVLTRLVIGDLPEIQFACPGTGCWGCNTDGNAIVLYRSVKFGDLSRNKRL